MGYIRRDITGPAIAKWQYGLKFKNTILKYWPTRMSGGVKVFAPLFIYQNGIGIYKTPAHLKIYKLLGMKVKDLEAADYKGLENTYMYVPGVDLNYNIYKTQIESYIEGNSPRIYPLSNDPFNSDPISTDPFTVDPLVPGSGIITRLNPDPYRDNLSWIYDTNGEALDATTPEPQWDKDGWITTYLTYNPPTAADIPDAVGDNTILALIEAGDRTSIHFDDEEDHPLTFASLLDTENIMFENKVRIVQKSIEERTTHMYTLSDRNLRADGSRTSRYLKTAVVEYKFRRVKDAYDPLVATLLAKIETECEKLSIELNKAPTKWHIKNPGGFGNTLESSIAKQMIRMYRAKNGNAETSLNYNGSLKYDAMATLKAKDFGKTFSKQIKQGHTLKKTKWYKKLLVIVIDIIVIIIAVVLIFSGNFMMAGIVLSIGSMLQAQLAAYWARKGDYSAANYAMGHAEFLQVCATVVGIASIISSGYQALAGEASEKLTLEAILAKIKEVGQEAITDAMIQAAVVTVKDVTISQIIDYVIENIVSIVVDAIKASVLGGLQNMSSMTTSQILMAGIQMLNQGFSMYQQYIDPSQGNLDDKKAELEASNKALDDTSGPETLDTVEVEYSDPFNNWIDMNEKMQSMPYIMTTGKNKLLMNKYFDSGY